jgi:hypothetical protein
MPILSANTPNPFMPVFMYMTMYSYHIITSPRLTLKKKLSKHMENEYERKWTARPDDYYVWGVGYEYVHGTTKGGMGAHRK